MMGDPICQIHGMVPCPCQELSNIHERKSEFQYNPILCTLCYSDELMKELQSKLDKKDEEIKELTYAVKRWKEEEEIWKEREKQLIDGIYATKTIKDLESALKIARKALLKIQLKDQYSCDCQDQCSCDYNFMQDTAKKALTNIKKLLGEK